MEWITEAHRVLKENGSMYVCGFSEVLAELKVKVGDLFPGCRWLVWYYRNKANLRNDWGRSHESLLHFRKGKKYIFNTDAVRIPYNEHTLKYPSRMEASTSQYKLSKGQAWLPHPKGARPKDVFEIPTLSNNSWQRVNHPTQKPVELVKRCVLASSNVGSLVVDLFGGSGTTYVVAEAFKRRWLGGDFNFDSCFETVVRFEDESHVIRIRDEENGAVV